ncbi:hypothetical protein B0J14DRAFT_599030 [Halenospora varia]|nr:hypothetical protein B0J14DRAFT_599030 [Halenospora varia]
MSVLFTSISPDNPVKKDDVQNLLDKLGVVLDPKEVGDFHILLAAVHDCAAQIQQLLDYQPKPDRVRYPRKGIHRPSKKEQFLGQAWAHTFLIRVSRV